MVHNHFAWVYSWKYHRLAENFLANILVLQVSVFDSIVQGGDGVWEGLRIYRGKIFKLEEHLDR